MQDALSDAIGDAIDGAVGEHERGLVTKWIALVETVGPDGDRGLWTLTSDGINAWDSLGLLTFGLQLEQARAVAEHTDDD